MTLKKSLDSLRETLNTHTPTEGNIRISAFYQCNGPYFAGRHWGGLPAHSWRHLNTGV